MSSGTVGEEFELRAQERQAIENSGPETASPAMDSLENGELETIRTLINKDAIESDLPKYEDFLVLYRKEIEAVKEDQEQIHANSNSQSGSHQPNYQRLLAVSNYQDVLQIADVLARSGSRCRVCVREELKKTTTFKDSDESPLNNSIDMALRLWLMLNIRQIRRNMAPDTNTLQWNDDDTLSQLVKQQFPESKEPMTSNASHRVDADFTVVSLQEYRGIDVKWTTSLEDHLRLKYDRKKKKTRLRVFPFKRILMDHLKQGNTIYPKSLLKEAIWTLDLLFPVGDSETIKFLANEKEGKHLHDMVFWETAPPGFNRYRYWKARLVELHDEFHAPPQTLWRALKDSRNIIFWWTFWLAFAIAVMTFVFGVITCVLTGLLLKDALDKRRESSTS